MGAGGGGGGGGEGGISLNGHGVDDPTSIRVQKLR